MAPLLTLLKSAVVFRLAHAHADAGDHHDEESLSAVSNWGWSAMAGLPHEASDLTATYVGDSTIILAGGCVSHQVSCDWYEFCTFCPAISNRAFAFDASSDSFEELATMPVSRYRHAAAFSGGEVFLVGGRDVDDGVVGTVDAYSVAGKTWRSVSASGGWAPTSDLNAFAYGGFVYVYGGYDLNYETAATAGARFSTNDFGVFTADVPSLTQGRGDFGLVVVGAFAVAAGGWHEGDWCIPLASTETLDLSTAGAEWQPSNSLVIGRGDVAAVTDGEHSVVLGGEHNNGCATASVPVSDVEMRLGSAWTQIGHIPEQKMRLAAAAVGDDLYVFGGQASAESTCAGFEFCYPVTNHTWHFNLHEATSSSSKSNRFKHTADLAAGLAAACVAIALCACAGVFFLLRRSGKHGEEETGLTRETSAHGLHDV